jgi:hypothetical protein
MEDAIKSFQPGFLLRSLFAGAFFPIAYYVCSHSPPPYFYIGVGKEDIALLALISLLAGVTTYALHRSIVYPLIECILDIWYPRLISDLTIDRIQRYWEPSQIESKLSTWGDYSHSQYCTALCIGLGALAARLFAVGSSLRDNWALLLSSMVLFFAAGFISDCRLRAVRDRFYPPPGSIIVSPTTTSQHTIKSKSPPKTKVPSEKAS